ncbi:hypothetical protein FNV43_RR09372 [Rhamnella rubrinervis]|uniref:Hexosyltransferase n=1 Tax=Rhamnella rubrinervis TaxID=2594499 RepID=A0A8K0HAJ4_9ROSA|nr:hypothetical protein FNV43_RR09372 [Rhamnella rubrinervis]
MHSRPSQNRLSGSGSVSRISALPFAMFATMAAVYVAGRLWQEAEERVYLIQELDKRTGQGQSAISVEDTLKIIACREQQKKLSTLEMELAAARQEGFVPKRLSRSDGTHSKKKLLAVIGIVTTFGRKRNRDAIRKAWMPTGSVLKKLADEKGIIVRFVIGRSPNRGDSLDREINSESRQTNDFIILDGQVEAPEERPKKMKAFVIHAVENWDAEFYAKVNDDIYVNIDALGAMLTSHLDKAHVYLGCMKSGEVFSEPTNKWYEPDWWKFGDAKSYFRHASGETYVISRALAQYISINRSFLRTYAHDDVSAGSWFIGLDVEYINDRKFCCSSWSPVYAESRLHKEIDCHQSVTELSLRNTSSMKSNKSPENMDQGITKKLKRACGLAEPIGSDTPNIDVFCSILFTVPWFTSWVLELCLSLKGNWIMISDCMTDGNDGSSGVDKAQRKIGAESIQTTDDSGNALG